MNWVMQRDLGVCNQDLGTLMVRPIQDLGPLHAQKYPLRQAQKVNKTRHDYSAPENTD